MPARRPSRLIQVIAALALGAAVAGLAASASTTAAAAAEPAAEPYGPQAAVPSQASLAVWSGERWQTFWSADRAPAAWAAAHPAVAGGVVWRDVAPGLEVGDLRVSGSGSAWRLRVVLARLDPRLLTFELRSATRESGLLGAWTVDSMSADAIVAFNAGQFQGGTPWGWQVQAGRELQPPGRGPLAMAVVFDTAGVARLLHGPEVDSARQRGAAAVAFQSYPAVLMGDGVVPEPLLAPGRGVDLTHRDARLALGILPDGRLLLALTRFDALGEAAGQVPFGPTTPEMAALMGALGCRRAVLLDGGLSAQLAVRADDGTRRTWHGLRRVPLGIVATASGTTAAHRR